MLMQYRSLFILFMNNEPLFTDYSTLFILYFLQLCRSILYCSIFTNVNCFLFNIYYLLISFHRFLFNVHYLTCKVYCPVWKFYWLLYNDCSSMFIAFYFVYIVQSLMLKIHCSVNIILFDVRSSVSIAVAIQYYQFTAHWPTFIVQNSLFSLQFLPEAGSWNRMICYTAGSGHTKFLSRKHFSHRCVRSCWLALWSRQTLPTSLKYN